MQRFRGGLVFKAHRLCVSLNSRLEGNKEEENVASSGKDLVVVVVGLDFELVVPVRKVALVTCHQGFMV